MAAVAVGVPVGPRARRKSDVRPHSRCLEKLPFRAFLASARAGVPPPTPSKRPAPLGGVLPSAQTDAKVNRKFVRAASANSLDMVLVPAMAAAGLS
jgi:hypothetical protein